MKFLIASFLFMSASAFAVCVPGDMSCATQCEVVVNGSPQTYTCGGSVYCNSDTGYCDVDINGIRIAGKTKRIFPQVPINKIKTR